MKLNFYDIDNNYTDFIRQCDSRIPYLKYDTREKFLCGIVLTINNINYYVPVSSNKNKFFSSFIIYDEKDKRTKTPISSLRFSFMFPCPIECIKIKNIRSETDKKYRMLMQKEYEYCNKHINKIRKQALRIYNVAKNEQLRNKYNLCNFQILEECYKKYVNRNKIKKMSLSYLTNVGIYDRIANCKPHN